MKPNRLALLLFVPGTLWGLSFLATEYALESIPPVTLGLTRSVLAGIPLIIALYVMGGRLPRTWQEWKPYIILGLFNNSIPLVAVTWGQLNTSSSLTTILVSLNPLFTLLLAHFFIEEESLNRTKLTGISLGLVGVIVLVGPTALQGLGQAAWGQLAIIAGAFSYAIAAIYARRHLRQQTGTIWQSIIKLMSSQYITSAITLLPLSLWLDQSLQLRPTSASWLGILALSWPFTLVPVTLYYYLIDRTGPSYTSLTVYLIPPVGIFAGIVFLDERLTWQAVVALLLILAGIAVVNDLRGTWQRWRDKRPLDTVS
jgi:drug/metabolite transporter (DMT)-like permease